MQTPRHKLCVRERGEGEVECTYRLHKAPPPSTDLLLSGTDPPLTPRNPPGQHTTHEHRVFSIPMHFARRRSSPDDPILPSIHPPTSMHIVDLPFLPHNLFKSTSEPFNSGGGGALLPEPPRHASLPRMAASSPGVQRLDNNS